MPTLSSKHRVLVGLSGGVDSSVSALLLKNQSYEVTACFMKNWEEDDTDTYCSAAQDLKDAQAVADKLDIELLTINFSAEYWDHVFEYFLAEYKAYRTPNPDILCNKEIKFKYFLDFAKTLNFDWIATGHYARNFYNPETKSTQLLKGLDPNKDQSYFLHAISQESLSQTIFPIGHLEKPMVRKLAEQAGLLNFNKKDSTGICFIGEKRFKEFLTKYIPHQPGDIISESGKILGQHDGLMYYTLGQRSGLSIGGVKNMKESPWYVAQKNIKTNQLLCVQEKEHPLLLSKKLMASQVSWLSGQAPDSKNFRAFAKTRYRQADQACEVQINTEGELILTFDQAQWAATPGQSAVLYLGDICLGGGVIQSGS